MRQLVKDSLLF